MKTKIIIINLMLCLFGQVFAYSPTSYLKAYQVEESCTKFANDGLCLAYLSGFLGGAYQAGNTNAGSISTVTFKNVFLKHMKDRPQDGDRWIDSLLSQILNSKEVK